ncbi:MAG: histidinol-phosphate transaminase [Vallitalea sp.]|jgi:histidinol-phosphate aminotransferase|nr:histidinol-phosphate transaminase [Vallitalea sp.]
MINEYIRKDLRDFKPYDAPVKEYEVKIDANENPYVHNKEVVNKVVDWLQDCNNIRRYPDSNCTDLRVTIAKYWNVSMENVVCGVGSDQLIDSILRTFIEPGDKVLMPTPSFSMYKITTKLNRGIPIEFSLNNEEEFYYPIEKIIDLYKEHSPKCVFLCTPNNPTGNILPINDIERLLEVIKCPVIMDEAYGEFVSNTMIDKINKYNNIIVLKTFSKAYGLAGLRVGYGIASEEMINAVKKVIPPYHLNSFSQFFAQTVIENIDEYESYVKEIIKGRQWLYKELGLISYVEKVYPSEGNYILIKVTNEQIAYLLEQEKILVRGYGKEGALGNCIRITVGTKEENIRLIEAMKRYERSLV